jgi:Fe(3+) dicitrate transport protein
MKHLILSLILSISFAQNKQGEVEVPLETNTIDTIAFTKVYNFPQVDVIGRKPSLLNRIPGSADIITEESLKSSKPITGNEMFKKVTGINVIDEDGAGLRANIGMR